MIRVQAYLDESLVHSLDAVAERQGWSRSKAVEQLLLRVLAPAQEPPQVSTPTRRSEEETPPEPPRAEPRQPRKPKEPPRAKPDAAGEESLSPWERLAANQAERSRE